MNQFAQYVGIGAGILTSFSLVPQLYKIIKGKKQITFPIVCC
jgi:uncharacterized protein with PQ loop repeat